MIKLFVAGFCVSVLVAAGIGTSQPADPCALVTHDVPIEHDELPRSVIEDAADDINEDPIDKPYPDAYLPEAQPLPEPRRDLPRHAFPPRRPIVRP
jgi:hypothetical protein